MVQNEEMNQCKFHGSFDWSSEMKMLASFTAPDQKLNFKMSSWKGLVCANDTTILPVNIITEGRP